MATDMAPFQQTDVLKQLCYQAREAKMPVALSILHRKLCPGKTFADFYEGWFPPKEYTKPFTVGDKTYHHFFPIQLRVINAVNMNDPSVISTIRTPKYLNENT